MDVIHRGHERLEVGRLGALAEILAQPTPEIRVQGRVLAAGFLPDLADEIRISA